MIAHDPWIAFPAGIIIASVVSAIGLGGGIFWMPFFLIILKMEPNKAILTSLFIQIAGVGSSTVAFLRQKKVDVKLGLFLMSIAVPGVMIGALLSHNIDPSHIGAILGIFAMTTAFLFVSSNEKYDETGRLKAPIRQAYRYSWIVSLMSIASGMLSISIGEWLIPILKTRLSMMMSSAIATSVFVIFGTCVVGTGFHLLLGSEAHTSVVLWAIPGVIIGGQIGPRLSRRINDKILKEIFIFLLTLIGIHLIYNAY